MAAIFPQRRSRIARLTTLRHVGRARDVDQLISDPVLFSRAAEALDVAIGSGKLEASDRRAVRRAEVALRCMMLAAGSLQTRGPVSPPRLTVRSALAQLELATIAAGSEGVEPKDLATTLGEHATLLKELTRGERVSTARIRSVQRFLDRLAGSIESGSLLEPRALGDQLPWSR